MSSRTPTRTWSSTSPKPAPWRCRRSRDRAGVFIMAAPKAGSITEARATPGPPAPATRVRYGVLGFLCALAFVLYVDRICISKAAPSIQREFRISKTAMGVVFAAFTVAYGLFEVPTGRWGDRYGSRGVL